MDPDQTQAAVAQILPVHQAAACPESSVAALHPGQGEETASAQAVVGMAFQEKGACRSAVRLGRGASVVRRGHREVLRLSVDVHVYLVGKSYVDRQGGIALGDHQACRTAVGRLYKSASLSPYPKLEYPLTTRERRKRWRVSECWPRLVLRQHRVRMCLTFRSVRRRNRVNDGLSLLMADFFNPTRQIMSPSSSRMRVSRLTLIVVDYISKMVLSAVVRATNAHGVVG